MLTTAQAIRDAIEAEYAAARFYDGLSAKASSEQVTRFLRQLADDERDHARAIERERERIRQGELPGKAEGPIVSVETAPGWEAVGDITLTQAISLAIEAEHHAALYYDAIADCVDRDGRRFFRELAQTEEGHARQLEQLLETL